MVVVRRAGHEDAETLLRLVRALADYEKLPGPTPDAEARLVADAFGPRPRFHVFLVERAPGDAVGYAAVFETYSTFRARPVLYLEDLFVLREARGTGAGVALMRRIAREAIERGCARVSWIVLDWNESAQRFYERLGATRQPEWWPYVLEGDALARLAQGSA